MSRTEKPTVGVEFMTKNIVLKDGTITKARLWDTGMNWISFVKWINENLAGSEKYIALTTA